MSIIEIFKKDYVKEATIDAEYIFQVKEYGGELWLTYSGCLVCPCSMLKDAPVDAVTRMRELYVGRKTKKQIV